MSFDILYLFQRENEIYTEIKRIFDDQDERSPNKIYFWFHILLNENKIKKLQFINAYKINNFNIRILKSDNKQFTIKFDKFKNEMIKNENWKYKKRFNNKSLLKVFELVNNYFNNLDNNSCSLTN